MAVKGEELKRVTKLSYSAGFLGVFWFIVANPQQIWSIFLTKQMGATSSQLGVIVGLTQIVAVLHLSSIFFYSQLRKIKPFWLITSIIHRALSLGMVFAALYVYRGGDRHTALIIVAVSTVLSLALANTSSAGWFTWMSRLVPPGSRSTFFGRRSAINQMSNVAFFFTTSWILDIFNDRALLVYCIIYFVATLFGISDILLHIGIPDQTPPKRKGNGTFSPSLIAAPLKNRRFLYFCFVLGFSIMGFSITNPFLAPWMVDDVYGLGAPNLWIGITVVISQTTWVLTASFWGKVMDRLGKKGVVMIGSVFPVFWLFYLLANGQNYYIFLPLVAFLTGLVTSAFFDGLLQITYSLSDEENQTAYMAWHWAFFGVFGAIGPFVGGAVLDWANGAAARVGLFTYGIHINVVISVALTLFGLFLYSLVDLKETPVRKIIRIVMNPNIFRTMNSLAVVEKEKKVPGKVENSLRRISGTTGLLGEPEIINRLHDPEREVREEAARTLGRIGSEQAVDALIGELTDTDSTIRAVAARSLSKTGNRRAIPFLIGALADTSEELQEVCAEALGDMDEGESVEKLLDMVKSSESEKIKVSGAVALSKKGRREAAEDIFVLMKQSGNRVFRKQLAIALANILGKPGGFYAYLQGDWDESFNKFYEEGEKLISRLIRKNSPVLLKHLRKELLPSLKASYGKREYNRVVRGLKQMVLEISYALYQKTEKELEEKNLRMLFWFLNLYDGVEPSHLDVLLCFYAIVYGQYLDFM